MARVDIVVTTKGVDNADPTKAATGGQSAEAPVDKLNVGNSGKSIVATSIYANRMMAMGKQTLSTTFNYYKSKYADFTGDYIGQTKIDNAFSTIETLGGIVTSGVTGFASGGVVGAVVGVVMSVGSLALNSHFANESYKMGINRTNAQASFNSARLGAILVDGNRGGW